MRLTTIKPITPLLCDNECAIGIATNVVNQKMSKYTKSLEVAKTCLLLLGNASAGKSTIYKVIYWRQSNRRDSSFFLNTLFEQPAPNSCFITLDYAAILICCLPYLPVFSGLELEF